MYSSDCDRRIRLFGDTGREDGDPSAIMLDDNLNGGTIVVIRRALAIFSRPEDRFIMCNNGLNWLS